MESFDTVSWAEVTRQNLQAARLLAEHKRFRSAVSRAYYTAFSAVTDRLRNQGQSVPRKRESWAHMKMPLLLDKILNNSTADSREEIVVAYQTLYQYRIDADYFASRPVDEDFCDHALATLDIVLRGLSHEEAK